MSEPVTQDQLDHALKTLSQRLRLYGAPPLTSFGEGLPDQWESYKPKVRAIALERLNAQRWQKSDIGSGRILDAVIDSIQIHINQDIRNNMVPWDNRRGDGGEIGRIREVLDAPGASRKFEELMYQLYRDERDEAEIFDELIALVRKRYMRLTSGGKSEHGKIRLTGGKQSALGSERAFKRFLCFQ